MRKTKLLWAVLCCAVVSMPSSGEPAHTASRCAFTDNGPTVTLSNATISATVAKDSPTMTELRHTGIRDGRNLISNGYYLLNYVLDETRLTYAGANMRYRLVLNTPEHVEVSLSIDDPNTLPFVLDYRFVVRSDTPGVYVYSIWRYPDRMPSDAAIEQSRYALQFDAEAFPQHAVEDRRWGDRQGRFPSSTDLGAQPQITDATYRLPDGRVETKYLHSVYVADNGVNALFDDRVGIAFIRPSSEYMGGIPDKQDYFVERSHRGTYLHWYEQVRHYGVPNTEPSHGWEKIYGPFLIYVTSDEDAGRMWTEMKRQAGNERLRWPYGWVKDPLYESGNRGVVEGTLDITDGSSPKDAWVVLGAPEPNSTFRQNQGYLYYARADGDGRFRVRHVRPGTYTLYVQVDGVLGTFRQDGVEAEGGGVTDLGTLAWTPVTHGRRLWQIGVPDRSPREFRHGDALRQWGNWLDYPLDFPNGVDFVIGTSNERKDMNYAHPAIKTPGAPSNLKAPRDTVPVVWRIRFDAATAPAGKATLTFAIAGSICGSLRVVLNGVEVACFSPGEVRGVSDNDASLYRAGVQGEYRELRAAFDASLIKPGENIMTLAPAASSGNVYASLMYDCIRLEVATDAGD